VGHINAALRLGRTADAFHLLQQLARDGGLLSSADDDEPSIPIIRYHG
jgi:hypothetical protein